MRRNLEKGPFQFEPVKWANITGYGDEHGTEFRDCFIAYTSRIEFPEVKIFSEACLREKTHNLDKIVVINRSNFSYEVTIQNSPRWCLVEDKRVRLEAGESTSFDVGIDKGELPPSDVIGFGEILMSRPFLKRAYPFQARVTAVHTIPIPQVEVHPMTNSKPEVLRLSVRNGGGRLLSGYCYDRAQNDWHSFLLPGRSLDAGPSDVRDDEKKKADEGISRVFSLEKDINNFDDTRFDLVLICDCLSRRFRRIEINPSHYFPTLPFADKPFIDLLKLKPGIVREFEIAIIHPAFRRRCEFTVPEKLRDFLQKKYLRPGSVRFRFDDGGAAVGLLFDYVHFTGSHGNTYKMPIMLSYDGEGSGIQ